MDFLIHVENLVDYLQNHQDGVHILFDVVLVLLIANLLYQKAWDPRKKESGLTSKQIDALVEEWSPEDWEELSDKQKLLLETPVINSYMGTQLIVNNKKVLNFATSNFSGLADDPTVKDAAIHTLETRGSGSCGPRGFYGTVDCHLKLENDLCEFMGTDAAIVYSSSYSSIASVIPAFVKRGDIILCDESANYPILEGSKLSRGKIMYYRHNDMDHLEELLEKVTTMGLQSDYSKYAMQAENRTIYDFEQNSVKNRRFIIFEALSQSRGDIAPIPQIVALKTKYKFRLLVDESNSIGVLGATGRGITEHFGMPVTSVDIILGCLGRSLPSTGGFCASSSIIVDHQRLSAPGYVFSASLSPYLCVSASSALSILDSNQQIFSDLERNCVYFRRELVRACKNARIWGDDCSPIVPISIEGIGLNGNSEEMEFFVKSIADDVLEQGVAIARERHTLDGREYAHFFDDSKRGQEKICDRMMPHALRVYISAKHTKKDLNTAVKVISTTIIAHTSGSRRTARRR